MTPAMTIAEFCRITAPIQGALVPELRYRGLPEGDTLEGFRTRHAALLGADVPYWVIAWPGGQALARYLLDRPETDRKSVV